jgi:hypothetical protein
VKRTALFLLLVVCAVTGGTAIILGDTPATVTLDVPGRTNEHATAAASGSFVAIVWAATKEDGPTDLYLATSRDAGASFSAPVRVNNVEGAARVNGEQPPRVALVPRGTGAPEIHVVWTNRTDDGTRLMAARSADGGKTFSPATVMPGSKDIGSRGWQSLTVGKDGKVYALWLDHRDTESAKNPGKTAHVHHHEAADAPPASTAAPKAESYEKAQQSQLFFGTLDGTVAARSLARGVCYCCKTSLTSGADGSIYAAWRHVYEGSRRDIAFSTSKDGGKTFANSVRISYDDWQLDGCPENGPSLAVDASQKVHVAWPTLVKENGRQTLRVFYASSTDGKTFSKRAMMSTGNGHAYHPSMTLTPAGAPLVAWEETDPGGRRVKLARSGATEDIGLGVYPQLVSMSGHGLIAWTNRQPNKPSTIAVRKLAY